MRVLVVPNTANSAAVGSAAELAAWCVGAGLQPVFAATDADACDLGGFGVEPSDIGRPELAVALGGDGTILKAVHLLGEADTPVLGVKFGRLGFLSGVRPERLREGVEAALAGEARIERRATLRAEVLMDGRSVGTYRALNEVVVSRAGSGRIVSFELTVGGHALQRMSADGVVVATATGSTAYALSAGGPIVAPGFGGMVVVPVAPHTLMARALVTEVHDTVEVALDDPSRADACVLVDGVTTPCRRMLERVVVSRGEHDVALVKLEGRDFYETVASEFFEGR